MDLFVILALIQVVILICLASHLWPGANEALTTIHRTASDTNAGGHTHTFLHASLEETPGRTIAVYRCTCGATDRRELPAIGHQQLAFIPSAVSTES